MSWFRKAPAPVLLLLVQTMALEDHGRILQEGEVEVQPLDRIATENDTPMNFPATPTSDEECMKECIIGTLSKIYENRKNEPFCGEAYDFFSTNGSVKHAAFFNGKDCFLDTARFTCPEKSSTLLEQSYDETFANYTTETLNPENCTGPYYEFEKMQWQVSHMTTRRLMKRLLDEDTTHVDLSDAQDAIRDTRRYAASCAVDPMHNSELSNNLYYLEIVDLPVHRCLTDIGKSQIDVEHRNQNETSIETLMNQDSCKLFLPPTQTFKNLILRNCPHRVYRTFLALTKMVDDEC